MSVLPHPDIANPPTSPVVTNLVTGPAQRESDTAPGPKIVALSNHVPALAEWPGALTVHREGNRQGPWARAWRNVPQAGHHAYVVLDDDGDVLYVGQTRKPRERLREHAKAWGIWFHKAAAIVLLPVDTAAEARMAELGLAERLQPAHSSIAKGERGRLRILLEAEHDQLGEG